MDFHTKDIGKKIGGMFHREHLDKYARVNPQKHWKRIVIVCTFLNICFFAFGVYVYLKVSRGEFFKVAEVTSSSVTTVSRERLNAVISFYELKKQKFEAKKASVPDSVDPNL